jgi:hypothetical protein
MLYTVMAKLPYNRWLLYGSAGALILALGVSGSRSAVVAVVVVVTSLGVILLIRPTLVNRFGRHLLAAVILMWAISYLPIFQEGLGVLSNRFTESADEVSVVGGLLGRMFESFTEAFRMIRLVPIGGRGLGVGTSGGASFLTGEATFLLAENEWSRILLESGPILGLAYIAWRAGLTIKLGIFSVDQVRRGNTLPLFLFSAGVFALLQGTFGQPTSLGFAVVFAGLAFAARLQEEPVSDPGQLPDDSSDSVPIPARRISPYAERLQAGAPHSHPGHGSPDR